MQKRHRQRALGIGAIFAVYFFSKTRDLAALQDKTAALPRARRPPRLGRYEGAAAPPTPVGPRKPSALIA